jgi:hypothetical protein
MRDKSSAGTEGFSFLRMLARFTAGMGTTAAIGLALMALALAVPMVGALADWLVKQNQNTKNSVRSFLWVDSDKQPPGCVGLACGVATLPTRTFKQVGGADSTLVTARLRWPAPLLIEASPGTYLEVVGARDQQHPTVERGRGPVKPHSDDPADDPAKDTRPLLLANEVTKDGQRRPFMVETEGFVSAWSQDGETGTGQLTRWTPQLVKNHKDGSQEAAIGRARQWQSMKMRSVQFQPVPTAIEVDVLSAAFRESVPVGSMMAFEWQASGPLVTGRHQIVPSHSMLGVVTRVQELGQYFRLTVQIPRTSPYSGAHWLWTRLNAVQADGIVLHSEVSAVFFKPTEMLGATPDWWQLERVYTKLPVVDVTRIPAAAIDPSCADSTEPTHACVWIKLQGVAVPVQVNVKSLVGGDFSLSERAVFAGKAIRATDWAAMPREFRRAYGSFSGVEPMLSRTLIDANMPVLLVPQPWLKAGLPVSESSQKSSKAP